MATEVHNHSDQSMTSLVSGIVNDFQDLVKQQLQLTRREIEEDLHKCKEGAVIIAIGSGFLALGAFVLCLALVYLIHWLAAPVGTDPASFPLWACHAVVGGVLAIVGLGVVLSGRSKFKAIDPVHNPATQGLKENVQWLTTPK
jgi:Putative Actinobacterial Holin-X, holin superfamily III